MRSTCCTFDVSRFCIIHIVRNINAKLQKASSPVLTKDTEAAVRSAAVTCKKEHFELLMEQIRSACATAYDYLRAIPEVIGVQGTRSTAHAELRCVIEHITKLCLRRLVHFSYSLFL